MTIVAGIDGSVCSDHALAWAIVESRRRRTDLLLVHGWSLALGAHIATAPSLALLGDAAQALVDRTVAAARAHAPDLRVEGRAVERAPAHALAEAAAGAELLVVGSHGRGAIESAIVGSVADACLRLADVPVAVLRPHAAEKEGGPVVAGVDGSTTARAALELAVTEASLRGGRALAVHAWHLPVTAFDAGGMTGIAEEDWEADARLVLERAVAGLPVDDRLVHGAPADVLLHEAMDAALLVVGSRGLSGLGRMLLGSVSRRLVHAARCPVLVVPGSD